MKVIGMLALRAAMLGGVMMAAAACEDVSGVTTPVNQQYNVQVSDAATGQVLAVAQANGGVSGGLTVAPGAHRAVTVRLLNTTGGQVVTGPGDEIRVNLTNTVVASFQTTSSTGGVVQGTLNGGQSGSTTLRVQYLQAGFTVFESPSIAVTVG